MRPSIPFRHVVFIVPILLIATASAACAENGGEPSALRLKHHPLVNRIWSVQDQNFVDPDRVLQAARASDYVLLGETHDNPLHHQYQADVLSGLAARGRDVRVVMEMLTESQATKLGGTRPDTADAFFDAVDWEAGGWPARELYEPVVSTVLRTGLPLFPGNLDRESLRSLISRGKTALPPDLLVYVNDNVLGTAALNSMRDDILESHCGMLPDAMAERMILGQRTRDALMAKALIENSGNGTGVLIAGSGHVRNDHGVPTYLLSREPGARLFTLAWMEVREDVTDPHAYATAWNTDTLPFDYVWFTPPVERPDPCAGLKARHKEFQ